jgi:hypothetical protein
LLSESIATPEPDFPNDQSKSICEPPTSYSKNAVNEESFGEKPDREHHDLQTLSELEKEKTPQNIPNFVWSTIAAKSGDELRSLNKCMKSTKIANGMKGNQVNEIAMVLGCFQGQTKG